MSEKEDKRIISIGLKEPCELEEDTIYIDVKYYKKNKQIYAVAYSNEKFTFHTPVLAGSIITLSTKEYRTHTDNPNSSWKINYNEFVEDLVKSNNGEINYQRFKDSSKLVIKILGAKKEKIYRKLISKVLSMTKYRKFKFN